MRSSFRHTSSSQVRKSPVCKRACRLAVYKVIYRDGGFLSDVLAGIDQVSHPWLLNLHNLFSSKTMINFGAHANFMLDHRPIWLKLFKPPIARYYMTERPSVTTKLDSEIIICRAHADVILNCNIKFVSIRSWKFSWRFGHACMRDARQKLVLDVIHL